MKVKIENFRLDFKENVKGLDGISSPAEREGVVEFSLEYEIDVDELKQLGINTKEAIPMLLQIIKEANKKKS